MTNLSVNLNKIALLRNARNFGRPSVIEAALTCIKAGAQGITVHPRPDLLIEADKENEKVVVHCSGGIGRTGHVLAAWLVSGRGLSNQAAIAAVRRTGRNPYKAVIAAVFRGRNPLTVVKELDVLLNDCRLAVNTTF